MRNIVKEIDGGEGFFFFVLNSDGGEGHSLERHHNSGGHH